MNVVGTRLPERISSDDGAGFHFSSVHPTGLPPSVICFVPCKLTLKTVALSKYADKDGLPNCPRLCTRSWIARAQNPRLAPFGCLVLELSPAACHCRWNWVTTLRILGDLAKSTTYCSPFSNRAPVPSSWPAWVWCYSRCIPGRWISSALPQS